MAVTTSYSLSFDGGYGTVSVSQAPGIQKGGAVVATDNGNSAVFYYNIATNEIFGRTVNLDGSVGAVVTASTTSVFIPTSGSGDYEPVSAARLTNGNIVVTWGSNETTKSIYFRIFDSNLNPVTSGVLAETSTIQGLRPDVAALAGGGFVIAWEKEFSSTDSDPTFRRFDAAGNSVDTSTGIAVDGTGSTDDTAPSVIGLVDGGFAFGWHRIDSVTGNTSAYTAVRNGDGTARLGPTQFDATGTINRDMSLAARADGGYTVFYEDSGWSGATNTEVTAWLFSAAGTTMGFQQGSTLVNNNSDVSSASSADGYTVSVSSFASTATNLNVYATLYSPTGVVLTVDNSIATASVHERVADVSWISGSSIRFVYERDTASGGSGDADTSLDTRIYVATRGSTGDAANDVINYQFDGLSNIMQGLDGNDTLVGGPSNDSLYGGNNNDVLIGNGGNDYLDGGPGSNELYGGGGDDRFIVTASTNSIIESAGEGIDTVSTSLTTYTLPANVENLNWLAAGPVLGVGNSSDNYMLSLGTSRDTLIGLAGNDRLQDGGGAAGFEDTLIGGQGDDVYVVDVRGSSTIELPGEGTDEVQTTFNLYALQANVENLTFTDVANHQAGVGNVLDNTLTGNIGADDLFGREGNDNLHGGTGSANTLLGQEGDDIYHVEAVGDSVIEFAGQGNDTVVTTVANFTLPANVENLTFVVGGAHIGIGNTLANTLTGGSGADFLSAGDGADVLAGLSGADELTGGTGADQFRYAGNETGIDRIYDFQPGTDKIALLTSGYTPTATRGFVQGAAPVALDPVSTFLYNTATGIVSYDDDGSGAGAAVPFTQLNAGLVLSLSDFIFF